MITVYGKSGCPYTEKVIVALDTLRLSFTKKNIADESVVAELIELGGKRQVPYLVDGDTHLYESDDIVAYLTTTYGEKAAKSSVHVYRGEGLCEVCSSKDA